MKEWCLGFIFANDFEQVVLLRKSRTLHVGLWNGVGGKTESGESVQDSMIRECKEETRLDLKNWTLVGNLWSSHASLEQWRVHVFAAEVASENLDEITADWAVNAATDTPYKVGVDSLSFMQMAPHTELWVAAARTKLKNPRTKTIMVMET